MVGILLVNKWEIHKGEALKVRKVLDFWLMSKKGQTLTSNSSVTLSCEGQFCMTMTYPCEIYHTAKGYFIFFRCAGTIFCDYFDKKAFIKHDTIILRHFQVVRSTFLL